MRSEFEIRLHALCEAAQSYPNAEPALFQEAMLEGCWYVEEALASTSVQPTELQSEFLRMCGEFERGEATGAALATAARVLMTRAFPPR